MRNADIQSKHENGEKYFKHFRPCFDGHATQAESPRISGNQQINPPTEWKMINCGIVIDISKIPPHSAGTTK